MKPTTLATALDLASAAALLVLPPGLNTAAWAAAGFKDT